MLGEENRSVQGRLSALAIDSTIVRGMNIQ
jgi:hypothetical protein